ncbi:heavy metal translocating P-type ATPase [Robertkochia sediminum]|uniref:heavy metal translocating P-type ATPase n=1 Tax=Robertkochia sediminum TaxID=2785326 RepID=UPI0019330F17|nr:heavy metal translocating P-type ATPase metal-binding domain-containing protein [Robertkochia sediminum]MBL7471298.1 heavy metal translocating P-type ATPase metal-binding domain-containing protein [Robertkochia sediminum]
MDHSCYHCGVECGNDRVIFEDKEFCCNGCKTVYEILSGNGLSGYYDLERNPGISPDIRADKFNFLDNPDLQQKLLDFDDGQLSIVNLYIPQMHCSSCIWVLENLHKLDHRVRSAQVNFPKKTARITFQNELGLKALVILLSTIGYEPHISLDDREENKGKADRSLIYKLGVAGFAFGNVMLLSFPEYFEIDEFWLNQYKPFFRAIMFCMSLPVVFYAASSYFTSAWKGLRAGILNIDVPIALGIAVLFLRSSWEIFTHTGQGFFDSLTGLVFFLLLGRYFQQRTYDYLSFERDYKSYFPIGVTRIGAGAKEEPVDIYKVKEGDRLLIRNEELIPADAILIRGEARVDYSFVTGESDPVKKVSGEQLFAGGKQMGAAIEVEVVKDVSQSYLTQLWSNEVFQTDKKTRFRDLTNTISKYFTIVILLIALVSGITWYVIDASKAIPVISAILIVACPCALALSAPFTLGNMLRIFGRKQFYLKDAQVIERMAAVGTVVFDKTGTITAGNSNEISYEGEALDPKEESLLRSTLRNSNHPLSRQLYEMLEPFDVLPLDRFNEYTGKGVEGVYGDTSVKAGSPDFVGSKPATTTAKTAVHIRVNKMYKGAYTFYNKYRSGMAQLFRKLKKHYDLALLSGDNDSERVNLEKLLPSGTQMFFNQKPNDKLEYISFHQKEGAKIMMVGDGLNDAGALQQSDVGVAIAENVNVFSPACDAILDAAKLEHLHSYLGAARSAVTIIKVSFILSFLYNIVGLYFAVTGALSPVVAAILMPVSSLSVVAFTTLATSWVGKKLK